MGAILPKPVMTKVIDRKGNAYYAAAGCSLNGFRENMEDAHCIHFDTNDGPTHWGMFGIFDGHVNEKCSLFVGRELPLAVQAAGTIPMPDADLKQLVLKVDKQFGDLNSEGGSTGTFVIAHIEQETYKLQIANVGDSRVLLCRKGGVCEELTSDHKPENAVERRRIEECGGLVENNRVDGSLAVSRAFGDMDYKKTPPLSDQLKQKVIALPDITHAEIAMESEDFILICCDGVYEGDFSNEQIVEFAAAEMKETDDLAAVCVAVCEEALLRGSKDNISCMIIKCANGIPFTRKYTAAHECIPGPYNAPTSSAFVSAYKKMLAVGDMTLGEALWYRYSNIKVIIPILKEKAHSDLTLNELRAILRPLQLYPSLFQSWGGKPSKNVLIQKVQEKRTAILSELQTELDIYEPVPENMTTAQGIEWFEGWGTRSVSLVQDDMPQRLSALQQQLGLPMPVLLNILQRDGGMGGGRGGGGRGNGI